MGNITYGMISPHPPILVPKIGGSRIKEVDKTKKALEAVSKKMKALDPDTIIFITPHGEISTTAPHVYAGDYFEGNFSMFGAGSVKISCKGDSELAALIMNRSVSDNVAAAPTSGSDLDHGIMVPLYYIKDAGLEKPILPIAISVSPLRKLFAFGKVIAQAVGSTDKKVAIVASADMSHRLTEDAPNSYDPNGPIFDKQLVALVKENDVDGILDFDSYLADVAGQDALWSIAILLGALDGQGFKSKVLSYEGPFGVGYMVAEFEREK